LNVISGPGTGKTALLEATLLALRQRGHRVAALVGDPQTDNDARRLQRSGALVKQITTAGLCHLEAAMVASHLEDWSLPDLDFLFIENVGNLVCPTAYDLGEDLRVVLLSVTEGEDKPLKYPATFAAAHLAVITKWDLAEPCEFQAQTATENLRTAQPGLSIFTTSARTGYGMDEWLDYLEKRRGEVVSS
jgi:hydrogenase nickel incorporation protein HypB